MHVDVSRSMHSSRVAAAGDNNGVFDAGIASQTRDLTFTIGSGNEPYLGELVPPQREAGRPVVRVSSGPTGQKLATMTVPSTGTALIFDHASCATIVNAAEGVRITLNPHAAQDLEIPATKLTIRWPHQIPAGAEPGRADIPPALHGEVAQAPSDEDRQFAALIERSGLLDAAFYHSHNGGLAAAGISPALHYVTYGDAEGRKPSAYFDPVWYSKKYFNRPPPRGALRDYVEIGERLGRKPCAVFDPLWYASTYGIDLHSECALAHYLSKRRSNRHSPNPYFDVSFYLDHNPDVREADVDAFEHWLHWGIRESRKGSPRFNAEFVWPTYLNNNRDINAFEKFMDIGLELGWDPVGSRADDRRFEAYRELKRNCVRGPLFEELAPPPGAAPKLAKLLAFYLPQFHPIPQNDEWWGAGFTEWHNIPRAVPRYAGHYQPRIPRDLGFYSLESPAVMRRQVELARLMGLFGFCFYYYNFGGQRLLEKPLDAFVADREIDFPFCLIWANENWTRRWDGREREILIRQDYHPGHVAALVADIARYMRNPRYIRLAGDRPLLMLYRPDVIPACADAVGSWREHFRRDHGLDPIIVMAQTFGTFDPGPLGFDGALEFPPHKLGFELDLLSRRTDFELYDIDFRGWVHDYEQIVGKSLALPASKFPLIKTAFPSWDNDARTQGAGMSFANSTPRAFQRWLEGLIELAQKRPFFGEPFVCINAWNEWCEGAYLEPDVHFGYAYLNALARTVTREVPVARSRARGRTI